MNPYVSVLIPTYNQDLELLKECIDSALCQTYKNIEIIISDNLSSNGTRDLLNTYTDSRIKIVVPEKFLSMNENFAFCASFAKGYYISFLSSDDLLLPDAIQTLLNVINRTSNTVFGCGNVYHSRKLPKSDNHTKYLIRPYGENVNFYDSASARQLFEPWKMSSTWMVGNIIVRKSYENTGGLDKCDLLTSGDVWLTNALLSQGLFFIIDKPLALFRSRNILGKEVEVDRRLFDLTDIIILDAKTQTFSNNHNYYQCLKLIYRLGAINRPTESAVLKVEDVFKNLNRADLLAIIHFDRSFHFIVILMSLVIKCFDVIRKVIRMILIK